MMMHHLSKTCFKCGAEKPLVEFYRHKGMADGYLNKCKDCTKADNTEYRWENIHLVREKEKARARLREHGTRKRTAIYREKNPDKYRAHNKVNNAVRDKRLFKPDCCERCNKPGRIVAHHNSYEESQWLVVDWLCQVCHTEVHKELESRGIFIQ